MKCSACEIQLQLARIGSPKSILPSLGETRRFQSFKGILLVCKPDAAVSSCYWANRVWASRVYWPKCEGSDQASAVRWLEGGTLAFGRTLSYWPFLEILKAYFEISEDDDKQSALERISAKLELLFAQDVIPEFVAYLSIFLALPLPEVYAPHVRYLDGLAMGHQVFRSLRTLMERLAASQPLVLVLEDWHWADQSSAELLEHLLPLSQEARVLICITARPESNRATRSSTPRGDHESTSHRVFPRDFTCRADLVTRSTTRRSSLSRSSAWLLVARVFVALGETHSSLRSLFARLSKRKRSFGMTT